MARTASTLTLAEGDREKLEKISRTRTEQAQRVDRSRILLAKADGKGVDEIAAMYGVYVDTVNPNAHRPLDEPWRQSSG